MNQAIIISYFDSYTPSYTRDLNETIFWVSLCCCSWTHPSAGKTKDCVEVITDYVYCWFVCFVHDKQLQWKSFPDQCLSAVSAKLQENNCSPAREEEQDWIDWRAKAGNQVSCLFETISHPIRVTVFTERHVQSLMWIVCSLWRGTIQWHPKLRVTILILHWSRPVAVKMFIFVALHQTALTWKHGLVCAEVHVQSPFIICLGWYIIIHKAH